MKVKLKEPQYLGALEVFKVDRLRALKNIISSVKNCFTFSFSRSLMLWCGLYEYDPKTKKYLPYAVYNNRVVFLEMFDYQQRTRLESIKNSAPLGCLE